MLIMVCSRQLVCCDQSELVLTVAGGYRFFRVCKCEPDSITAASAGGWAQLAGWSQQHAGWSGGSEAPRGADD